MSDSDVSLPKSTMLKIIKERLPADMKLAADAGETMIRCCDEFVQMLSSTANEISDKEGRTTILPEHVLKAVEQLGFDSFLQHMNEALEQFKADRKETIKAEKEKKAAKANTGMSDEEKLALQQRLFEEARAQTLAVPIPQATGPSDTGAAAPVHEQQQQQQQLDSGSHPPLAEPLGAPGPGHAVGEVSGVANNDCTAPS